MLCYITWWQPRHAQPRPADAARRGGGGAVRRLPSGPSIPLSGVYYYAIHNIVYNKVYDIAYDILNKLVYTSRIGRRRRCPAGAVRPQVGNLSLSLSPYLYLSISLSLCLSISLSLSLSLSLLSGTPSGGRWRCLAGTVRPYRSYKLLSYVSFIC